VEDEVQSADPRKHIALHLAQPDLATARGWFSTSGVNGKVYVVGGQSLAPDVGTLGVKITFPGIEVYTPTR
jgi:hypothetical protein